MAKTEPQKARTPSDERTLSRFSVSLATGTAPLAITSAQGPLGVAVQVIGPVAEAGGEVLAGRWKPREALLRPLL